MHMITGKKVFSLTFAATLFLSTGLFAQSAKPVVTDVTTGILTWAQHVHNDLDKYYTPDKGVALNEQLEELKRNLTDYMKTRKKLSDSLFRHNIAPGKKDEQNLEALKEKMKAVMERMRNVTDLTSKTLREEGDRLNEDIYNALYGDQPRYLSNLEAFLDGKDVTKKDLAIDGSANYNRLEESVRLITDLQARVERKPK